jgi:hypothetical protein
MSIHRPFRRSLLLIAILGACDTVASDPPLPPRDACAIVAVHSDYRSTSVSLVTAEGAPCAPDLIDSGSRPPGLLTALSGDVVCGGPLPNGAVALIDRYPAGVATLVDPADGRVTDQLALGQAFAANPQDLVALSPTVAVVSRLQRTPPSHPDHPAGSDLLALDLTAANPAVVAVPIALDALADAGFDPMPARLATTNEAVFIGLAHLRPDFAAAGPGRIARITLPAGTTKAGTWASTATPSAIPLANLENCTQVRAVASGEGVWVVCSGSFRRGASQGGRSGLAFVTTDGTVAALLPAAALSAEAAPLGFSLAAIDTRRAVVVALGDPVSGRPDRALLVTLPPPSSSDTPIAAAENVVVLHSGPAFELGDILHVPGNDGLLLADGNPVEPALWQLGPLPATPATTGETLAIPPARRLAPASRTGLPPRWLCPYKDLQAP